MKLNQLSGKSGARRARMRLGRGIGSGKGKTCGRGCKGQKSRSGVAIKGFEGGQMPIHRRLPKRGFTNIFRRRFVAVNLGRIQTAIDAGKLDAKQPITAEALKAAGVITHPRDGVRVLANGDIGAKVTLRVAGASKAAVAAVEKAGGAVELLVRKTPATGNGVKSAKAAKSADNTAEQD